MMNDKSIGCFHDLPFAIETFSGVKFDVMNPKPGDVRPIDLAHALARIGRYGGHCRRFYSVAAHSIHCCDEAARRGLPASVCLMCLLHDGGEAFTNDLARPIKTAPGVEGYHELTERVQECVYLRFAGEIGPDLYRLVWRSVVKRIDNAVLAYEVPRLMGSKGKGWKGLAEIEPARIGRFCWEWYNQLYMAEWGFLRRLRKHAIGA